ncbi:hypothetical protein ABPG77_010900 [Micractinium sp. CCAP 211/92]
MPAAAQAAARPYQLDLLPVFGAEVHGIDLKEEQPEATVEAIKEDVLRHRLLVFRDQGIVSGDRQVAISRWFGPLESTFYKHPLSPHPDVFRVSNDPAQGCTGVGRTGWHVDGSFQRAPFSHAIYHIWSCPSQGDTVFAPLHEIVNSLSPQQRARWDRLWMLSDRRSRGAKPLIYQHPLTGQDTLCFHLGMMEGFVWDLGTPQERVATPAEARQLLAEMERVFTHDCAHLLYQHKWRPGDFIISDNLALGHEAAPDTQLPPEQVGLRVMHRTTVAGQFVPQKRAEGSTAGRAEQQQRSGTPQHAG